MTEADFYLFDMDHTLIGADCDVTWKSFAVAEGLAPASALDEADRFYRDYVSGTLDSAAFGEFQYREYVGRTVAEMAVLAELHFEKWIRPHMYRDAVELVTELRGRGKPVGILTSSNHVVATPVARAFGIDLVLGTRLEVVNGRYTGETTGTYGAGEGKVAISRKLLEVEGMEFRQLAYFGDSINDRHILSACGFPHTVNPDPALRELALARNWKILNWS